MPARFTYSRWDGTQTPFSMDADGILDELADDLMYHGDLDSALRRLMREGMTDKDGKRIEGLREMMERIRQRKRNLKKVAILAACIQKLLKHCKMSSTKSVTL